MKIRCDVCDREEASLFCSADEAALCNGCDRRIHHANKLASKHLRFSLVQPNCKESPLCDTCQERRALLFCQEDRAILCRECDLAIHKANEYTQKHNRFLLTGIKLSASSSLYPTSSSPSNGSKTTIDTESRSSQSSTKKSSIVSNEIFSSPSIGTTTLPTSSSSYKVDDGNHVCDTGSMSTSSITEYLMETLPGWRVDDFLDPASTTNGFCKTHHNFLPFVDQDLQSNTISFSPEDFPSWVPKVSPQQSLQLRYLPQSGLLNSFKKSTEASNLKVSQKWSYDAFTVPQISSPSLKKSKHCW